MKILRVIPPRLLLVLSLLILLVCISSFNFAMDRNRNQVADKQTGTAQPEVTIPNSQPNVIFILADDMGWGDPRCYGNKNIHTPNLDRLAKQGTLFTHFYVNAPVCSPARVGFYTGRFPGELSVHNVIGRKDLNEKRGVPTWLDPSTPTITKSLHAAGYKTAHFGKWHLGSFRESPSPGEYGIDVHRTLASSSAKRGHPTWSEPMETLASKLTGYIADETIQFLRNNREQPFYINVCTLLPHATLNPTEEQMQPFEKFSPRGNNPHKGALQIYYASIADIDKQIGRILDELDNLNLTENTIVVFSSDNGPEDIHSRNASHSGVGSTGPFRGRKRSLYDGGVRMPFLIRWPGKVPAGVVNNTSVISAVDFMPSIMKLTHQTIPDSMALDGEDVSDIWLGSRRQRTKPLFWEWRFHTLGDAIHKSPMLAIREDRWKLLMNPNGSRIELYDLQRQRTELDNVASTNPEIV